MSKNIILITGCSSGIGAYCARQLAQDKNWHVVASARREADVAALRAEGFDALRLDLDSSESIRAAVHQVLEQHGGRLDALFNNGAYGQMGAVEDLSRDALREQFETNLFGTQELTNAVLPVMRRQGGGKIIQNSSVLGFVSLPHRGAYNASKHALEALTDTMRLECAGSGVYFSLIEPGPITSAFRDNAVKNFHRHFDEDKIAASVHAEAYRAMAQGLHKPVPFNLPPEAVYKALARALAASRPKERYRVTVPTKFLWWFKRVASTSLLDAVLRRL